MSELSVTLRPGRDKSVLLRHPWIFASAILKVGGKPQNGETVLIHSAEGKPIALAAYSGDSQIRARVWSWDVGDAIDQEFIKKTISNSVEKRRMVIGDPIATATRLVFGEADGFPGLVVDKYCDVLVVQILSAGPERFMQAIFESLQELFPDFRIYERSDVDIRKLEGLEPRTGPIVGVFSDQDLVIEENGLRYLVDIKNGQKTGFYIDQRENRQKLQKYSAGKDVLNCFSYTGGFTLNALKAGAKSVLSVDSSADAIERMTQNIALNGLDLEKSTALCGDVFKTLRLFRDQAKSFDVIVLDPPKFAPTIAQAEKAARGYKDINLLAFKLLRPGGVLFTFSCSGGISRDLFQKIVTGAATDAGVSVQILEYLSQSSDHPVLLSFPESFYLKGLVCRI
jgi:23S rRNA (cytosine1962-C5)-methyltransferase